ncbi:phosphatidate cytidylyltransferase [Caminibacter pacificus]|jgi:phosphatidate cytidylyltransferase
MKERLVTSVILITLLLVVGLIDNVYLTGLLIAVIAIAGMYEAKRLFGVEEERVFYFLSFMAVLGIFVNPILIAVAGILSVGGYIAFYQKDINPISIALYPFLSLMILFSLYLQTSMGMIGWLILVIASTDSFAYLIGKNFKGHFFKEGFSPTSPNKSWEGVIGGVASGTILGAIVGLAFFNFFEAFIIALSISIASVFGDLFESYLKRRAGVKDSGNILPGHGGVLDRIDGYLFGAPVLWAIILSIGH